jgi:TrpR family trp operon transcriptional repressor
MCKALAQTDDQQFIEDFLRSILTPAETADIAARWALVKCLDNKIPQREIAKNLGLSLCKITRGSRELKRPDPPFKRMLELAS